jgi:hypothetical protein
MAANDNLSDPGDPVDMSYRHWFSNGMSVRDSAAKAGVGASTLQDRITKIRSRNPDLDDLREFTKQLKVTKKTLPDLQRYSSWKDRLDDRGISTEDLEKCVPILTSLGDNPVEKVNNGQRLAELEAGTGKSYEELVNEVESLSSQVPNLKTTISNLQRDENNLRLSLANLEELTTIQGSLKRNRISVSKLDGFIKTHNTLNQLGFGADEGRAVAAELVKINPDPKVAIGIYKEKLAQYGKLVEDIKPLEGKKKDLDTDISNRNGTIENLKLEQNRIEEASKTTKQLYDQDLKKHNDLIDKNSKMEEEIKLGLSLCVLLLNPRSITTPQLQDIIKRLQGVFASREGGYTFSADSDLQAAINSFYRSLASVPGVELVPKSEFDKIKGERDAARKELGEEKDSQFAGQKDSGDKALRLEREIKAIEKSIVELDNFLFAGRELLSLSIGYDCSILGNIPFKVRMPQLVAGLVDNGFYEFECNPEIFRRRPDKRHQPHKVRLRFIDLYGHTVKSNLGL